MNNQEKMINHLNDLLTKNYDAEAGYKLAADNVDNTELRSFLEARSQSRYDFGHALKEEITKLGGTADKGTSVKGDLHRAWMNLKDAFSSGDSATYAECVRGEEAFVEEYEEFLNDRENLPPSVVKLVESQLAEGKKALLEVKALKGFKN